VKKIINTATKKNKMAVKNYQNANTNSKRTVNTQHLSSQSLPKRTKIGIFWFEKIQSGNPGSALLCPKGGSLGGTRMEILC
jgi:hypothetical protein